MNFSKLGLDKWLVRNLEYLKYSNPTEVQEKIIPQILKDKENNLLAIANTGQGKTASFCLPILSNLAIDPYGIYAIILEPTRELAVQVLEKLKVYSTGFNLRANMIIGGMDITEQLSKMDSIPHIIVATPGRLAYLLQFSPHQFKFIQNVKYLILDEFDQLLNETILEDINTITSLLPKERQTLFFSATINYKIHTDQFLSQFYTGNKPLLFDLTEQIGNENSENRAMENQINSTEDRFVSKLVKELVQKYVLIPKITKEHYLIYLMQNDFKRKHTIIFVATCKQSNFISHLLNLFGMKVSAIHSKMPQNKRFQALDKFKAKLNTILIATDIASRGLDIPKVELVINYDIPRNPDDYIHRVGRTARAGNPGLALSFVSQYDVELILAIEDKTKIKMDELAVSEDGIMENLTLVSKGIKIVQTKIYETGFEEKIDKKKNVKQIKNKETKKIKENLQIEKESD